VIASSGSGYAIDKIVALESGADEYVTKPIDVQQLLTIFEKLTGQAGANKHAEAPVIADDGTTRVRFWGVRGSIPAPGPETVYYGGNTSCVEIRADGELIILDAGTGIRALGQHLRKEFDGHPVNITILISHTHWDHIQGFPFFAPAYDSRNRLRILAFEGPRKGLESTLSIQMESPYFPIAMHEMPSHVEFTELKNLEFNIGKVKIQAMFMNHPGICAGYRLFTSAGSVAYFPDNELSSKFRGKGSQDSPQTVLGRKKDQELRDFIEGADVIISDAQYDLDEYAAHIGWGHSCVDDVVPLAMAAKVKKLFLFHHDPDHDDAKIAQMLASAREHATRRGGGIQVEAAREGLEVVLKKEVSLRAP
jgi:phosphoribosyl 1,2-cyclic phosphodiesterase